MIGARGPAAPRTYDRGLAGLVAGDTAVSRVDGVQGRLLLRGYPVEQLAARCSFEEVSYLVLQGELPGADQLQRWRAELARWRRPPPAALASLRHVPHTAHPLALYRTMLTVAACHLPPEEDHGEVQIQRRQPPRILGWTASMAAAAIRHLQGLEPVEPDPDLGYAAGFLYQIQGQPPDPEEARAFEVSLIVQVEHGLHAAAFAALVVASTGADLGSAVLAGMGALSGVRHGGANQLAFEMLERLEGPDQARRWAREALARGHRFPGFGHRVYRCPDPRVRVLEPLAELLLRRRGLGQRWETYLALRQELETALGPRGIFANVDSITGLVYSPLGLPASALSIPFCLAIQTGWMAHCLEYVPRGAMIEPGAVYETG